ncbi:hypothetical protein FITA111629_15195 [Filibacter tadaridae]|uniref:Lumazine-binding domain protein n=1 Tax=Filibacter tadaridae TaxID=2483811 RepID=A0A3P5W971_9BACL|nr:hypothetical protein [Filibacter tadaridae]VDC18093.1 hypothetical protein FILTAD_00026 [Filibacter tadaridae]
MKNVLKFLFLGVFLFSMPLISQAEEIKVKSVGEVIDTYLTGMVENDVHAVVNNVNDTRYNSLEQQISEYKIMLIEDKLVDYEILGDKVVSNNEIQYIARLEFATGEISEVPMLMTKEDSRWKVNVSNSSLENEEYKILQEAISETTLSETIITPLAAHFLCDWNFSGRRDNKEFYSNCTFDINKSDAMVNLVVHQDNTSSHSLGIAYTIVKKKLFGDEVWGSNYVSGTKTSNYLTTITGKSKTFSGAKVRFLPDGHYEQPGFSGVGGIY